MKRIPVGGSRSPDPARPRSAALGDGVIILLGLPRSGTTLLQRLLGEHSAIHTVAEPWLMLPLSGLVSRRLMQADYDASLADQALESFASELPGGRAELVGGVRRLAVDLYASCRQAQGARYFLDKTPRYHYIVPELVELLPDARFVVLRRNPLSVLASVAEAWFGGDVNLALGNPHHQRDLTLGFEHLDQAPELLGNRACSVRYESLVADPEAELRRLCAFLDLEFEPATLQYDPAARFKGSFGDDIGVPRHRGPVHSSVDAWRDTLFRRENVLAARDFLRDVPAKSLHHVSLDRGVLERELDDKIGHYRAKGEL